MKTLSSLLLLFITVSCATKPTISQSVNEESEIVQLVIEQYNEVKPKEFRLIEKPDNNYIASYQKGLYQGPIELPGVTFSFIETPATKWDKEIIEQNIANKKVVIIKDRNKIKNLTNYEETEKSDIFFIFSNPIFSNNDEYALINVYSFFNHIISPSESNILIFKKINGKWTYIDEFAVYVS